MFKILFNRSAPLIRLLEVTGIVNSFLFLKGRRPDLLTGLCLFLLLQYLFIRICDTFPWYSMGRHSMGVVRGRAGSGFASPKRIGIRVHFQKALVPTSYLLAIVSTICLFGIDWLSLSMLLLADFCMLIITAVNGILIWFHLNDREELPINYFSLKRHQQGGRTRST
ncbi:MAG: hypothetical protein HYY44_01915 [Deltaproteobacteria bacterium]|nr:hypothetical protein [Deltaproteobacteria bacterium]MBI4373664.1 hypothetical protein [Deltaproteobacteria bacterium]